MLGFHEQMDTRSYLFEEIVSFFFFQAEDGIRDLTVTGVQTCALPILRYPFLGPVPVQAVLDVVAELQRAEPAWGLAAREEIGRASRRERVGFHVHVDTCNKNLEVMMSFGMQAV